MEHVFAILKRPGFVEHVIGNLEEAAGLVEQVMGNHEEARLSGTCDW